MKRSRSKHGRNSFCSRKRAKAERENSFEIRIFNSGLTREEACEIECQLISQYGRIDNGTGILTNMTDGGEGTESTVVSIDTRDKLRQALIGRKHTKEAREKMSKNNFWKGKKGRAPTAAKAISTPEGIFESCSKAAEFYGITLGSMSERAKSKSKNMREYFYL